MFTGIIQEIGLVEKIENISGKRYITISCKTLQHDLKIGESIACNGICLTVIKFTNQNITIETMAQTMATTTVKSWTIKTSIHLEKALSLSDRLNGHLVQGHIDTITYLKNYYRKNNTLYLVFTLPSTFIKQVVEHGSICIDGVSLTITKFSNIDFEVALIEHTLKTTHLGNLKIGNEVNIEFDIIGKYVAKQMGNDSVTEQNINLEWGKRYG